MVAVVAPVLNPSAAPRYQPGMMGRGQPSAPIPATMSPQLAASRAAPVAPAYTGSEQGTIAPVAYAQEKYRETQNPFDAFLQGYVNAGSQREANDIANTKRQEIAKAFEGHPDLQNFIISGVMDPADATRIKDTRDAAALGQQRKAEIGDYLTQLAGTDERYGSLAQAWSAGVLDEDGLSKALIDIDKPPTQTDDQRELAQINQERSALGKEPLSLEDYIAGKKTSTSDKPPLGYRYKDDGTLEAIPGGPKDPKTAGLRKLSAAETKELFDAQDAIDAGNAVVPMLERMKTLNSTAWDGPLADAGTTVGALIGDKNSVDTQELKNLTIAQALEQLKAVFGAMPTEGERKILLEIQGSVGQGRETRQRIYERALAAAKRRIDDNSRKAEAIRTGDYLQPGYGADNAEADPGETPAQPTSDEEYNALPSGALFIDPDDGQTYRKP